MYTRCDPVLTFDCKFLGDDMIYRIMFLIYLLKIVKAIKDFIYLVLYLVY